MRVCAEAAAGGAEEDLGRGQPQAAVKPDFCAAKADAALGTFTLAIPASAAATTGKSAYLRGWFCVFGNGITPSTRTWLSAGNGS